MSFAIRHPVFSAVFLIETSIGACSIIFWHINRYSKRKQYTLPIKNALRTDNHTQVDSFWSEHTVSVPPLDSIRTAYQTKVYLRRRFADYPLWKEFMQLYGEHDGQVVLDYGCGPGHDLVGFLLYTKARRVVGIDISQKALEYAHDRLALLGINPNRVELIRISDSATTIPLDDNSIDYVYCEGVLHHTTDPGAILREFYRILKPGSKACLMVYNCSSIWFHLYVAYQKMIVENKLSGMDIYQAFAKSTDTEQCPISRCYKGEDFVSICNQAGFSAEYVGGHLSLLELDVLKKYKVSALQDGRLSAEHRDFLKGLAFDKKGLPKYKGKHAGIGGVYRLCKASRL